MMLDFRHVRIRNENRLLISTSLPVHPSVPCMRIFVNFYIGDFYENCRENPNLIKRTQKSDTLHEDVRTFRSCRRTEFAIQRAMLNIMLATTCS
jgi:hypothetical protein